MDRNEIFEKVKKSVAQKAGIEVYELSENISFTEDLEMDSLDLVELTMALEEEFEIEITDEDSQDLLTVEKVTEYIESRIG